MQTLRSRFDHVGPLAGRSALALIFIVSGLGKLADPATTGAYIASQGLPLATLLAVLAGALEVAGGLSVALGARARWGAIALAAFLVPATIIFHNPVGLEGMAAQMEIVQVLKNIAILGGLLTVASLGAGPVTLDARLATRRAERAHA